MKHLHTDLVDDRILAHYPKVVIMGRPNVGKSTLFNRLCGERVSIVEDEPGVTRDRLYRLAHVWDKPVVLVDTGGWEFAPDDTTETGINAQVRRALDEADLVLFVVDGRHPPAAGDFETADMLRRAGIPAILVVNKIDGPRHEAAAADAYALGMEPLVMVSAAHGRACDELEDAMYARLPAVEPLEESHADPDVIKVAVVGRPNAGKSTLVNTLLNDDRLLTEDRPGTTRDAVDVVIERNGRRYVFVDTAGMRKKARVSKESPEYLAVRSAVSAIARCHVAVLLVDATADPSEQDAKVLGLVTDRHRAAVIAVNKWDKLSGNRRAQQEVIRDLRDRLAFAPWAPILHLSAKTGKGLEALFRQIDAAFASFTQRVSTSQVNALFADIVEHHPPPLRKGRPVKLFYAAQTGVRPPTFTVHCSYPEALHFSYRRYVENRIREAFGFDASPIDLVFKKRKRRNERT